MLLKHMNKPEVNFYIIIPNGEQHLKLTPNCYLYLYGIRLNTGNPHNCYLYSLGERLNTGNPHNCYLYSLGEKLNTGNSNNFCLSL